MEFTVSNVPFILTVKANENSYTLTACVKDTNIEYKSTWFGAVDDISASAIYYRLKAIISTNEVHLLMKVSFIDVLCSKLAIAIRMNEEKQITFYAVCDSYIATWLVKSIVDKHDIDTKLQTILDRVSKQI